MGHSPCEIGQSLNGLCDERETAQDPLLWQRLHKTEQTRRQNRGADESKEDARADQLTSDGVTVAMATALSQRRKYLPKLSTYVHEMVIHKS